MSDTGDDQSVLLVTWNILATKMGTKKFFPEANDKDLDPLVRRERVLDRLAAISRMAQHVVFLLQEVDEETFDAILSRFEGNFHGHRGFASWAGAGYMSVAILYPSTMACVGLRQMRLADMIPGSHRPVPRWGEELLKRANAAWLCPTWLVKAAYPPTAYDVAKTKWHQMLIATLAFELDGVARRLTVATVHIPCTLGADGLAIRRIFIETALSAASKAGAELLAGDFNTSPADTADLLLESASESCAGEEPLASPIMAPDRMATCLTAGFRGQLDWGVVLKKGQGVRWSILLKPAIYRSLGMLQYALYCERRAEMLDERSLELKRLGEVERVFLPSLHYPDSENPSDHVPLFFRCAFPDE